MSQDAQLAPSLIPEHLEHLEHLGGDQGAQDAQGAHLSGIGKGAHLAPPAPWAGHPDRAGYLAALADWTPYIVPDAGAEDDDDDRYWETPWDPGAPPLHTIRARDRRRFLGRIPARREVLAGQIARARERLGAAATIEEVAAGIAVWCGDPEFLMALTGARFEAEIDLD